MGQSSHNLVPHLFTGAHGWVPLGPISFLLMQMTIIKRAIYKTFSRLPPSQLRAMKDSLELLLGETEPKKAITIIGD